MIRPLSFVASLALFAACNESGPTTGATVDAPTTVSASEGLPDPVGQAGERKFTLEEIESAAAPELAAAKVEMYEARKRALDTMIAEHLLDEAAKARGITRDELLKAEVEEKVSPPTDEEIDAFYEQNKSRIRAPLEAVRDQVVMRLQQERMGQRMRVYLDELREKADVQVHLAPPRFEVSAEGEPRKGPETAPVTIVEFSDYQCPYCKVVESTIDEVLAKYPDEVAVVYRHFPLPSHPQATPAAIASECAFQQGKFWEYHDKIFENQRALADEQLKTYATDVGLDMPKFEACFASEETAKEVQEDIDDGRSVGMSGTPGFYVNGRMLSGAQPLEAFVEVIDEELAAKKTN